MNRGEYHLALVEYGEAMVFSPPGIDFVRNPEVNDARHDARETLSMCFRCGGDPDRLPAEACDGDAVRSARLPSGHLVVAAGGGVLAVYPLTDEGRRAAVAHADALAADQESRFDIDNRYLVESDEFDTVVYAHEGGRAVEVYRAEPREEADTPDA